MHKFTISIRQITSFIRIIKCHTKESDYMIAVFELVNNSINHFRNHFLQLQEISHPGHVLSPLHNIYADLLLQMYIIINSSMKLLHNSMIDYYVHN